MRQGIDPLETITMQLTAEEAAGVMEGRHWEEAILGHERSSYCGYLFNRIATKAFEQFGPGWLGIEQERGLDKWVAKATPRQRSAVADAIEILNELKRDKVDIDTLVRGLQFTNDELSVAASWMSRIYIVTKYHLNWSK